jgi:hypothetical protein
VYFFKLAKYLWINIPFGGLLLLSDSDFQSSSQSFSVLRDFLFLFPTFNIMAQSACTSGAWISRWAAFSGFH